MRFYHWYYMYDPDKQTTLPCYRLAFKVKSKHGYYGFMFYRGEFVFKDNLENPEHLNDKLFMEEDILYFNKEIIDTIFKKL